jgi:hypothetical protein
MSPALLRAASIPLLREIASKRLTVSGFFWKKYARTRYRCRGATPSRLPCRFILGLVFWGTRQKSKKSPDGSRISLIFLKPWEVIEPVNRGGAALRPDMVRRIPLLNAASDP